MTRHMHAHLLNNLHGRLLRPLQHLIGQAGHLQGVHIHLDVIP